MGCLRVEKIIDYLCEPLRKCLKVSFCCFSLSRFFSPLLFVELGLILTYAGLYNKDDNPYVRKTAAICVAKLYEIAPDLAIDNGFVAVLQEMVSDINPMVRAG